MRGKIKKSPITLEENPKPPVSAVETEALLFFHKEIELDN